MRRVLLDGGLVRPLSAAAPARPAVTYRRVWDPIAHLSRKTPLQIIDGHIAEVLRHIPLVALGISRQVVAVTEGLISRLSHDRRSDCTRCVTVGINIIYEQIDARPNAVGWRPGVARTETPDHHDSDA